jgi:hypothetical protein
MYTKKFFVIYLNIKCLIVYLIKRSYLRNVIKVDKKTGKKFPPFFFKKKKKEKKRKRKEKVKRESLILSNNY